MENEIDQIKRYGQSLGWVLKPRTVLVEGTRDAELFEISSHLEKEKTGTDLLDGLAIVAAGEREQGGTNGVIRELIVLRGLSRICLDRNGRTIYRFIGLFDNDTAGRNAVKEIQRLDTSVLEYKDVFRLQPVMPIAGNLDPKTLRKTFEKNNNDYKGLDWEIEDLLSDQFFSAFLEEYPDAVRKNTEKNGKIHRELTDDGKAHLHRFIKNYAIHQDIESVVRVLQAIRHYLLLK